MTSHLSDVAGNQEPNIQNYTTVQVLVKGSKRKSGPHSSTHHTLTNIRNAVSTRFSSSLLIKVNTEDTEDLLIC